MVRRRTILKAATVVVWLAISLQLVVIYSSLDAVIESITSEIDGFQKSLLSLTKEGPAGPAIAVVITLTREPRGQDGSGAYLDGAAVLAHSIRTHIDKSRYRKVELLALCGPNSTDWSRETFVKLADAGWEVRASELPISIDEIENEFYRNSLPKSGCCGEAELVKLHAFNLVEYDRVLLLDTDSLLLQPIDELLEEDTDAVWTVDVFLGRGCINGGFLVLTPSRDVFSGLLDIARKGDFRDTTGWGGVGIGWCYGGQTFQGIIPYYFQHIHEEPLHAGGTKWRVADMCVYNNIRHGQCLPGEENKNRTLDKTPVEQIKLAHYCGSCPKPFDSTFGCIQMKEFCVPIVDAWWAARHSLEKLRGVNITRPCENRRYSPLKIWHA